MDIEAHEARNTSGRRSNVGEEMSASEGYQASQVHRKRIEEVFGWVSTVASLSKTRHRGLARMDWQFTLALAAYDLIQLPKLLRAAA
ncbi:MAG: transposase [Alphaproteobacteria bacterium]|nr:transposase [Alphaproteobacteria bacterium]